MAGKKEQVRLPVIKSMAFKQRSFTLIELILVFIILSILIGLGATNYLKARKKIISREGLANIRMLAAAQMIHKKEQGGYLACTCTAANCNSATGCNTLLYLSLDTTNWSYNVAVSGAGSTVASIRAQSPSGCSYVFDSSNFDNGTIAASGCL